MRGSKWIKHHQGHFALALAVLCGICSALYLNSYMKDRTYASNLEKATILQDKRRIELEGEINHKKLNLLTIERLFSASDFVSFDEFTDFVSYDGNNDGLTAVCWQGSKSYAVGRHKGLCAEFEILEPNKIVGEHHDHVMYSRFVRSRSGQKGYASIIFPLSDLLPQAPPPNIVERFVVQNTSLFRDFELRSGKLVEQFVPWGAKWNSVALHQLEELSGFTLIYANGNTVAREHTELKPQERTIIFLVVLMSILVGIYLKFVINQKVSTERTVRDRTKRLSETNVELEKARKEAVSAAEHRSMFLANMSHEIRTPLNGIVGTVDLLKDHLQLPEQVSMVRTVQDCCEMLQTVIGDVLDFSKMDAGKIVLEQRSFDLQQTLYAIAELHRPVAESKNLPLRLSLSGNLPKAVIGDEVRIKQIVGNLVSNAIKFTHRGAVSINAWHEDLPCRSTIDKSQRSPDDTNGIEAGRKFQLFIEVEDTGIGIDEAKIDDLFESFSQLDASTTRGYGGTGLGLAIVKKLTKLMDGDVTVNSQPQQGARFRVNITVAATTSCEDHHEVDAEHLIRPSRSAPPQDDFSSIQVLVAEDNEVNRIIMDGMLRKTGVTANFVENGKLAVDHQKEKPCDLILMDCHMPVMDGLEATRTIRSNPEIYGCPVIIAVTASVLEDDVKKARSAGMDHILPKPVRRKDLQKMIRLVADGKPGDSQ